MVELENEGCEPISTAAEDFKRMSQLLSGIEKTADLKLKGKLLKTITSLAEKVLCASQDEKKDVLTAFKQLSVENPIGAVASYMFLKSVSNKRD